MVACESLVRVESLQEESRRGMDDEVPPTLGRERPIKDQQKGNKKSSEGQS